MKYKLLGKSGLRVSELALGTMTFGEKWGLGASKEESKKVFDAYTNNDGNFIDTANRYTNGTSEKYSLPSVISAHNNFWIWGWNYLDEEIINVIVVGGNIEDHLVSFEVVEQVLVHKVKYAMPYENNLHIFIGRNLIKDVYQIWESNKHFE